MTTTTTGIEFKRFYLDSTYWPEGSDTYYDDVLLHVDGHDLTSEQDPRDIADTAVVEIRSGWVMDIPSAAAAGVGDMSLEDYFVHWKKKQSTRTIVIECPQDVLWRVIQAVKAAGGEVKQ